MTEETKKRRPFHETIVDIIMSTSNREQLLVLGMLIKETQIPKGHDQIIEAWKQACQEVAGEIDLYGVRNDLLEQKREAEEKEKAKQQEKATASASPAAS